MQVTAEEGGQAAIWHYEDEDIRVAAVWTEKKKGRGEDAPPTALYQRQAQHGLLAVYDGVGGSGAGPAGCTPDGQEVSGAFVASRVVHFALEDWFFRAVTAAGESDPGPPGEAVEAALRETGIQPNMKIRGALVRHLPTTLAAIEDQVAGAHLDATALWAGDSRAYVLDDAVGLQAITRDDSDVFDALTLLINDQPMTNMISADRPVKINSHRFPGIKLPVLLICATDGFFNYVPTPAHFEHLLLLTMNEARDLRSWAAGLAGRVAQFSGDDASMVAVSFGYPTFEAMRLAFEARCTLLEEKYAKRIRGIDQEKERERFVAARKSCWDDYRPGYERLVRHLEDSQ